jgi:PAS domain S-box-containing protein
MAAAPEHAMAEGKIDMGLERIGVLLVEDNPADARLLREAVREAEGSYIQLTHVETLREAFQRLNNNHFDVVMLDLSLPDADGLETLVSLHTQAPSVPIVVLTGLDDEALAVKAVREGAQDYLVKGQVTSQLLVRAMRYATERKRAVEALQRSEEYFRSLIENALDLITVLDMDGTFRYGSPSVERVLGYKPAEIIGVNALSVIHPRDAGVVRQVLEYIATNSGPAPSFEFRILHKNKNWRVLEATGKRFEVESSVEGFVLNSRDITERKNNEEAIRQANETLRAVIETSPLAIYSLDLQGTVQNWNIAAERIFGFTEAEVKGKPLPTVFPEDWESFRNRLQQAAHGHIFSGMEARRQRKDGTAVDVSIWSAPLRDALSTITGIVVVLADNTDRKRLEEQFRQAQKMEAVGRLAGGVAHDFNNLLTVITGYNQMLLDRYTPSDPVYGDIQQVLKAADRATTLTKQLLAFSRRQIVQPKVVDLTALVLDMDQMLKRLSGEDVELVVNSRPATGRVRVDPGHIEQVIVNLVVNARDAMPAQGGRIDVDIRNVHVDDASARRAPLLPGSYVVLSVRDTGVGIDEETRSHLFEPFFTTKEKGRGTGLGLSTSYGIVKQNHGEILVRSEPGAGSTFEIYLPQVEELPEDSGAAGPATMPVRRGAETVLIAEDEDGVRKVVRQMLEKQGYTVLTANGGHEAIQICRSHGGPLQLLITDVVMPRMSGRELADRVRAMRPEIRVLFVSGYTDSAIVHEGELDPGTDLLMKPFTPEQLAAKVRDVLEADTARHEFRPVR